MIIISAHSLSEGTEMIKHPIYKFLEHRKKDKQSFKTYGFCEGAEMIKQRAYGFCEGAVDDKTESLWLL